MRHCVSLFVIASVVLGVPGAAAPTEEHPPALVVIDIQEFYFPGGALPLTGVEEAAATAARVLAHARARGWPVIHVQHLPEGQDEPSQSIEPTAYRIHPLVAPLPGETVIGKHHANAFRDTELASVLHELGVSKLVIIGMQTQMCVEAATRAAADLGFAVTVVGDACAARPLEYGGVQTSAAQVHAATLASLQGTYATIVSADELLAQPAPAVD